METITNSTPLVQLTVGQLSDIIDERVQQALASAGTSDPDPLGPLVWGNAALAEFLGCSKAYASIITTSGKYAEAIVHPKGSRRIAFYPKVLKKLIKQSPL